MLENYKVLPSNLVEEHYQNANKLDLKETLKTYDMSRLVEASKEYKRYFESQDYKDLQKKIDNEIEMILKENEAFEKALKEVEFERLNRPKPEVKIEKLTIVEEILTADEEIRQYIKEELTLIKNHKQADEILAMHIHPLIREERFKMLMEKIEIITK